MQGEGLPIYGCFIHVYVPGSRWIQHAFLTNSASKFSSRGWRCALGLGLCTKCTRLINSRSTAYFFKPFRSRVVTQAVYESNIHQNMPGANQRPMCSPVACIKWYRIRTGRWPACTLITKTRRRWTMQVTGNLNEPQKARPFQEDVKARNVLADTRMIHDLSV